MKILVVQDVKKVMLKVKINGKQILSLGVKYWDSLQLYIHIYCFFQLILLF